jgi:Na+/H+ antiporter NhaD/arsenite permease-like protein
MRSSTAIEKMAAVKLGQSFFMMLLAIISLKITPVRGEIRRKNEFSFYAIIEVAVLFFGIFLAMIPALQYLNTHGSELFVAVKSTFNIADDQACPMIPFWLTGTLSSFLDNAPTYLTFMATIQGSLTDIAGHNVTPAQIAAGTVIDISPIMLAGLSTGAVFMGSMTYIGNGPNFMVKSIAEQSGVKMPSFFGYMVWSILILIPIFILLNYIWFQCIPFHVIN